MSRRDEVVSFSNVTALHDTENAVMCKIDGAEMWIPKSQIVPESEVHGMGDHGTLTITEWFAIQKELV